jgi:hypothetical protein
MKRSIFYVFFIVSLLFPFYASADDFDQKDLDITKHKKNLQKENLPEIVKNNIDDFYKNHLTSFPPVPGTPNYTLFAESTDRFKLVFWRQAGIPFVRITPLTGNPTFICGASFEVIASVSLKQYGFNLPHLIKMSNVNLIAEDYSSFCDDIYEPKTFIWGQWSHEPQYDDSKAFVMIHWWNDEYIIIPAADGSLRGLEEKTRTVVIPLP